MSGMDGADLAELPVDPETRQYIERLEESHEDLVRVVSGFKDGLESAHDELSQVRSELDDFREENDRLREELADLKDRTDLQNHIEDAAALKVEDRAKVCIQTCVNEAQRRGRNGEKASATMDYNGARKALGGGLADQQLLDALKRADDLVDSPAVRFKKETRAAQRNSRLIVDLEAGDLPARYYPGGNRQPTEGSTDA